MSLFSRLRKRACRDFFKWRYLEAASKILGTKPLTQGSMPFLLLSMVQKRDVISYLVAVKSFALHANPHRVVVVCDPSIDDEDRAIFRRHVPHIELRQASEFADSRVPRGGTWERLQAIALYVRDTYVIQLDSDTTTIQPIPEVLDAIRNGTGFVLGEKPQQQSQPIVDTSEFARLHLAPYDHIQAIAELRMVELGAAADSCYVRGCSGFTGFPQTSTMLDKLIAYSTNMQHLIGARWTEWGTEQVTSNYLVANANGTKVLSFPDYCTPDQVTDRTAFLHFIGYTRFVSSYYEKTSASIIRLLGVDSQTN